MENNFIIMISLIIIGGFTAGVLVSMWHEKNNNK